VVLKTPVPNFEQSPSSTSKNSLVDQEMGQISLRDILLLKLVVLLSPVLNLLFSWGREKESPGTEDSFFGKEYYFLWLSRNTTALLGILGTFHLYNWLLSHSQPRQVVPPGSIGPQQEKKDTSTLTGNYKMFETLGVYDSKFPHDSKFRWIWVYTFGFYLGFVFVITSFSSSKEVVEFVFGFGCVVSSLFFVYLLLFGELGLLQLRLPRGNYGVDPPVIQMESKLLSKLGVDVLRYVDLERKHVVHTFPCSRVVIACFLGWWMFSTLSFLSLLFPIAIGLSCLYTKHYLVVEVLAGVLHSCLLGSLALIFL